MHTHTHTHTSKKKWHSRRSERKWWLNNEQKNPQKFSHLSQKIAKKKKEKGKNKPKIQLFHQ
jgi:hypothetical protein